MKNIKILFALLTMATLWSCDPLEDDIQNFNDQYAYTQDVEFTLGDDEYDFLDDEFGVAGFGSFNNQDEAKEYIPAVLSDVFPALGNGSSASVTYNLYNGSSPDLDGTKYTATVSAQEYEDLGFEYGNFNNMDADVATYANFKYPDAEDGDYADITFDYYDGSFHGGAMSRVVYTVAYGWQYAMILPDAAYGDFFLESGTDFSTEDEGEEKIPAYLNYLIASADDIYSLSPEEGDKIVVQYNFDDEDNGGLANTPAVGLYIYNGTEWVGYGDAYQVSAETLSFGHDGTTWVPDNTIKYTLNSTSDVDVIVNDGTAGDAGALANIAQYRNFNLGNWSLDQIYVAVALVLKHNFPNSEAGQKYLVTFSTYPDGDKQVHLILNAEGDYEQVKE